MHVYTPPIRIEKGFALPSHVIRSMVEMMPDESEGDQEGGGQRGRETAGCVHTVFVCRGECGELGTEVIQFATGNMYNMAWARW